MTKVLIADTPIVRTAQLTRIKRMQHYVFIVNPDQPWPLLAQCLSYQARPEMDWRAWDTACVMRMASVARLHGATKLWDAMPEPRVESFWARMVRKFFGVKA